MNVTWTPTGGVELIGSDDLARAMAWREEADWGPDAPLSLQLDALAEAAVWCTVERGCDWGILEDAVEFEGARLASLKRRHSTVSASSMGSFQSRLFQFQSAGIDYLATRRRALLCDEQGLGKTVQALLAWRAHRAPTALLVVSPLSVLPAWAAACRDWLGVDPVHEGEAGDPWIRAGDVSLTTWERLPARPLRDVGNELALTLVVDEAHKAKNRNAKRTKAVRAWAQAADTVWGLTGTPILSHEADLPGVAWALDLPVWKPSPGRGMTTGRAAAVFASRIREHMLRRTRADVEIELPAKVYDELPVSLDSENTDSVSSCVSAVEDAMGRPVDGELVEALFGLAGDDDAPDWSKAMGVLATLRSVLAVVKVQQLTGGSGDKAGERESQVVGVLRPGSTGEGRHRRDGEQVDPDLQRDRGQRRTGPLGRLISSHGPLVVVSAHRAPVQSLGAADGWSSILGGLSVSERQRRIDAFQAGELAGLAVTIGAGGVGITLTRARCMVVIDRAWTAAENDQVEDRICRIGQAADTVHIVDVVADHPIDRMVARCITRKRALIRRDVDAGAVPDWREAHRARIARWRKVLAA